MELMPFKAIEKRGILVVHAWDAFTVRKKLKQLIKNEADELWD